MPSGGGTTPEPSSIMLFGSGILALAALLCHKLFKIVGEGGNMYVGVVAVASTGSSEVAVIDFSAQPPSSIMLTPGTDTGYVVDCYGSLLVTGGHTSGNVNVYSILDPGTPALSGSVYTGLSRLTAISTDGAYVLAGGTITSPAQTAIVLVSIADVNNPKVVSTYTDFSMPSISNVVIRYPKALACGPYDAPAVYYRHLHASSTGFGPVTGLALNDQVMGDFDGWNAAITSGPDLNGLFPPIGVFSMKDGYLALPGTLLDNIGTLASLAIAEVPEGGYYVALGMFDGSFGIITQSDVGNAWNLSQMPKSGSGNVLVKFLNNPAVAPFLAVANVIEGNKYYVNLDFLFLEGTGTNVAKLQISVLKTEVTLGSMQNPTLGITAFEPPPPWWRTLPWPPHNWPKLPLP
jgi:PEP-CTERM motif-containing protein